MDRYDEMAREVAHKLFGDGVPEVEADIIAAFGRECAALAYEDAAGIISDMADEADDRGNTKRRDFLLVVEDKFQLKSRALLAPAAKEGK